MKISRFFRSMVAARYEQLTYARNRLLSDAELNAGRENRSDR